MLTVLLRAPRASPKPAPQNKTQFSMIVIHSAVGKVHPESIRIPIHPRATGSSWSQTARNVAKAEPAYVVKITPMNIPSKNFSIISAMIIIYPLDFFFFLPASLTSIIRSFFEPSEARV